MLLIRRHTRDATMRRHATDAAARAAPMPLAAAPCCYALQADAMLATAHGLCERFMPARYAMPL